MKGPKPKPLAERFWARVPDQPGDDCWLWGGARAASGKASPVGYGYIGVGSMRDGTRRTVFAHRVSYELCRGPIPKGMFVCHACDNPPCVNPNHLFLGSGLDNLRDAKDKGRIGGFTALNAAKTHCAHGHAFTAENTMVRSDSYGGRRCRACEAQRNIRRRKTRRAA